MIAEETQALLALNLIPGVGSSHIQRLLGFFGSAQAVLDASQSELLQVAGLTPALAHKILEEHDPAAVDEELRLLAKRNCALLALHDPAYPERLGNIYDPPPILYIKGRFADADQRAIAVVGTRKPSSYGRQVTEQLVKGLVSHGFTIISGLARGIDGIAHRTALENGGRTLAVLGSGLGQIYPQEHAELADRIADQGMVISEFAMESPPLGAHFPQRNRVISGLSLAVLITEATERSGSLITARYALEQDREVLAVPGSILTVGSRGPNRLIRQGAALVADVEDILEALPTYVSAATSSVSAEHQELPDLNPEEQRVWEALGNDVTPIDSITQQVEMPPARVSSILIMMELKGVVRQLPGKNFTRKWSKGW